VLQQEQLSYRILFRVFFAVIIFENDRLVVIAAPNTVFIFQGGKDIMFFYEEKKGRVDLKRIKNIAYHSIRAIEGSILLL
jgi:hypothetical protein